ncbi:MAG TPA: PKD domain-containing protein, partial [Anaerolineales bacterium]|nr:PKD domain-containing protein [Anaerolineales bacterium]
PGYWGDRILLRIQLDPGIAVGTQLTNTIEIATANDTDPNDNWHVRNDLWTNTSHWNGYLNQDFAWGTLISGGEAEFNFHARNLGNMPIHAWFTDTLPANTSFAYAWLNVGPYSYPFPPDYVDDQIAVWDLGILEPGEWRNFSVHLDIDGDALPGDEFTNCAEIAHSNPEDSPLDNFSCLTKTLNEPGPNLEIEKAYNWNWEGQLNFNIEFRNVGTTPLYSVTLPDPLPADTTFNGNWWHWYWQNIAFTDLGDQLVWTIPTLDPGQSTGLAFDLDLDNGVIGVPGLAYTNTADAPIPGDVSPADNHATVVPVTGPDLYVEKWLSSGDPRPGEVVTFTVEFGNQNRWPWWANGLITLTETLPPEMSFITATLPWDPNQPWTPTILPGGELGWYWNMACPNCAWQFQIVVQITDTVSAWNVLPNTVSIFSDDPGDLEWDYGNNTATVEVIILDPQFGITKDYAGNGVAGTPITYTLLITNTGGWADTGILVNDLLPAYVSYTIGGDYDPLTGLIAWEIPALQPGESAEVTFSGVLACTPNVSVVNDTYQVTGSDEGITSLPGAPVTFDIAAPTLVAAFDLSADTILPGESITFTSLSTTNGTPIVSWEWDFGDGQTGSGEAVTHLYANAGVYDVSLTITDACGFTTTVEFPEAVTVVQTTFEVFLPIVER